MKLLPATTVVLLLFLGLSNAQNSTFQCPRYEEYICGSACPPTCQNKCPESCNSPCVQGCFCKKGYLRQAPGAYCVPESCENVEICKDEENKKFAQCVGCPKICNDTQVRPCPELCRSGCVCKENFVLDKKGGKCISDSKCTKCPENQEYDTCGTPCPGTCSQPVKPCIRRCDIGCFCKKGYILDDDVSKKCIKKEECPKTCN